MPLSLSQNQRPASNIIVFVKKVGAAPSLGSVGSGAWRTGSLLARLCAGLVFSSHRLRGLAGRCQIFHEMDLHLDSDRGGPPDQLRGLEVRQLDSLRFVLSTNWSLAILVGVYWPDNVFCRVWSRFGSGNWNTGFLYVSLLYGCCAAFFSNLSSAQVPFHPS